MYTHTKEVDMGVMVSGYVYRKDVDMEIMFWLLY